ncbi:MAG: pilus assembly protein PilM [Patescibacteria group bacterium]|nr:pilus assembly protein PilM [Patescibacteria group bacterium]MDE2438117.1 pilus assembly protein PilM [Patescibacteria group bacterium]
MSLFGPKHVIGLDVGTTSIKVVDIALGKQPQIANYGTIEDDSYLMHPGNALQSSARGLVIDHITELLHTLLHALHIKKGEVYATYPIFSSFATLLDFPALSKEEVDRAIEYSFRQYVPLAPEDTHYEWLSAGEKDLTTAGGESVVGGGTVKKYFFLTAISNKNVALYEELAMRTGLKLKSIESETLSLVRVLRHNTTLSGRTIGVLDIGTYSTNIVVIRNGFVVMNRGLDSGGGDITRSIARGLGVDGIRAETIKKTQGLHYVAEQAAVYQLIYFALDFILEEAKRVFAMYATKFSEPIDEIILVGGSSSLREIEHYLADKLQIKTSVLRSLHPFTTRGAVTLADSASSELVVALGAALKAQET